MQSFLFYSQIRDCSLHFHGDVSIGTNEANLILKLFPKCQVHLRKDSDVIVERELKNFPNMFQFRQQFPLMQKLVDPFIVQQKDKLLFLDSDVLFFRFPEDLLASVDSEQFAYNRDIENSYIVTPEEVKTEFGLDLPDRLNSGLWSANREFLDLSLIEKFLGHKNFET